MSVPEDDRTTSSQFSRTGSASSSGDYGSGVIDQLGQPLVVGMTPLATYAPTEKPNFTQETEIDIRDQYQGKAIHSLHEGTGDGILCFHPPELQDYMLHGSGVNPDSRWPTNISEVTVLLHNCGRADGSTGDVTVTRLAFGNPLSRTVKPKSGVYFEYDPSTGTLAIQHTDSSGADDSNGDITWNGTSLVGAGSGDISSGSNLTGGRVVHATGNKQIDTPIDLRLGYVTTDSADDTVQLLAGSGKRIEIRSPDKIYFDVNGTNEMIVEAGKVTIAGLLDPTGLEFDPVAANPGGTAANTLWLDSGDSNRLKHGAQLVGIINGSPSSNSIMYWNSGTKRLQDAGFAYTTVYRSGGTDVPITDGGTGASTADAAVQNLTNGATSRTPVLTDEVPFNDVGTGGGKTTPQALFNLLNSLTAETAPVAADKVPIYDASASQTDAVTIANLFGEGKAVVIEYTGSGSSGKTVTLTGINRASAIVFFNQSNAGSVWAYIALPDGSTGTVTSRSMANGSIIKTLSLDAPAAGTAQVLTISNTSTNFNGSANTYRLLVIGTPT